MVRQEENVVTRALGTTEIHLIRQAIRQGRKNQGLARVRQCPEGGSAGLPGPRGEGLASQLRKAALQAAPRELQSIFRR
jgi:hypothetical protein